MEETSDGSLDASLTEPSELRYQTPMNTPGQQQRQCKWDEDEKEEISARTFTTRASSTMMHDSSLISNWGDSSSVSATTGGMNDSGVANATVGSSCCRRDGISSVDVRATEAIEILSATGLTDLPEHDEEQSKNTNTNSSGNSSTEENNGRAVVDDSSIFITAGSSSSFHGTSASTGSFVTAGRESMETTASTEESNDAPAGSRLPLQNSSQSDNDEAAKQVEQETEKHEMTTTALNTDSSQHQERIRNGYSQGSKSDVNINTAPDEPRHWYQETWVMESIQPLPSPSIQSETLATKRSMIPGAYAVGGPPPQLTRPTLRTCSSLTSNNRHEDEAALGTNEEMPDVIEGAVVVDHNHQAAHPSCTVGAQSEHHMNIEPQRPTAEIPEIIEATIMEEDDGHGGKSSPVYGWLGILSLVLAACLVIALPVVLNDNQRKKTNNSMKANQTNGTSTIQVVEGISPFQDGLPLSIQKQINDTTTSAYMANQWMLQDPYLSSYSSERQRQRFLLVATYYALNGDNWIVNKHWLSYNVSECDWHLPPTSSLGEFMDLTYLPVKNNNNLTITHRIQLCDKEQHVRDLVLSSNNLTGELWQGSFEGFFPFLRTFDLGYNSISKNFGSIPSSHLIEAVSLAHNMFEGGLIGGGFHNAQRVKYIRLDGNQFQSRGNYAKFVFPLMPNLEVFNATSNLLGGNIASEIGLCPNLTHYWIGHNDVQGQIPSELGLLTNLLEIDASGLDKLNGTIPLELGALSKLAYLNISGTGVTGSLPESLCQRFHEGDLVLSANCSLVQCCISPSP